MSIGMLLDGGRDLPYRWRLGALAAPLLFAGLVLIADPTEYVAWVALIALSPWVVALTGVCLPWPAAVLVTTGAVAALMSRWRVTDLSLMLLVYAVGQAGVLLRRRESVAVWLLALGVPIGWQLGSAYGHMGAWIIGISLAWGCGLALRGQFNAMQRLEAAQEALARKAVADERRRIAREVHDLAAHSMAVTMLHLTGARLALADGEVAEAESALAAAERLGRSSMNDIRRAVGALTEPGETLPLAPEPRAAEISTIVEDYRSAGVVVDVEGVDGVEDADPVVGLALYRLVQESLANAARHAPGSAVEVSMRVQGDRVRLLVRNRLTAASIGQGHGLAGMHERVLQLGGQLEVGPIGAEWQVSATVPLRAPAITQQ